MAQTVGDFIVERLYAWGVRRIFGYPGDGINGFFGALNRADGKIEFIQARHEEMAAFMASMRLGTMVLARAGNSVDVRTVACMPSVLPTAFLAAETTRISARTPGQWAAGATSSARLSAPSARPPAFHATNPPSRLRHAEPEPWRAITLSSSSAVGSARFTNFAL